MRCQEASEHIGAYFDGELPEGQALTVAEHLDECSNCGELSAGFGALHGLLQSGLVQPGERAAKEAAAAGAFDTLWTRIESEIATAAPAVVPREEAAPSWWQRFVDTLRRGWPVWVPAAAAAALIAFFGLRGGLFDSVDAPDDKNTPQVAEMPVDELPPYAGPRIAPEAVAKTTDDEAIEPAPRRRGVRRPPEGMVAKNEAFIVSYEVERGIVLIDSDPDEPDQPMVVWHFLPEDEGEADEGPI